MQRLHSILAIGALLLSAGVADRPAREWRSTRVERLDQHARIGTRRYPFRDQAKMILAELDLVPGEAVADIGAGDGWWAARMAKQVGPDGTVYASEVVDAKVDGMRKKYAELPQLRPYLSPFDNTGLPENSCDLAFFAQVYHHLDAGDRIDYLKHLRGVVRPTGRVVIIERYLKISTRHKGHGTELSELIEQAEEAGWIAVRVELIPNTYHYLAIFAQRDLFPPEPEPGKKRVF